MMSINPIEKNNLVMNTMNLMDNSAGFVLRSEILDKRQEEYLDAITASKCCTQDELDKLDLLYKNYIEAKDDYFRYKNYLIDKAHHVALSTTQGSKYLIN